MLPSIQGLLILGEQLVVHCIEIHLVCDAVENDCVPPVLEVELRVPALLEQLLRFLQRGAESEAKAQQTVPRRIPPPGKDLMQIDLADAGALGKRGFGNVSLPEQAIQQIADGAGVEIILIFGQKLIEIGRFHQLLPEIVCVFHSLTAFTTAHFWFTIPLQ